MLHMQTWRAILADIIDDPERRNRLARALHVRPATLLYWTYSNSKPHPRQIRDLLHVVPEYHEALSPGLSEEVRQSIQALELYDIPQPFRDRFSVNHSSLPRAMRTWSLCQLALQQMAAQLDPYHLGIMIKIVRCMPPSLGGKVRSLREVMGTGTPPWQHNLEHNALFLGRNSLAGYAIAAGHLVVNDELPPFPTLEHEEKRSPFGDYEASAVCCPIVSHDRIAGCLYLASVYEAYFTPARLHLIQCYAEMLASAFEPGDFHDPGRIELWDMPAAAFQQRYLSTQRQRIVKLMTEQHCTFADAEQLVWQQIEQEMLQVLW